ncbi:MAG: hypothetical protein KC635_09235, partial [Myxococcales bacterium]|nr:hypothetical protein [Myxococcales bacterium]
LKVIPVGEPTANIGIEAFNVRPYLDDSLTYAVFVAVHNASDQPHKATLFLYANEKGRGVDDFIDPARLLGSYSLDLPANGSVQRIIDDVKFPGSRLAARVAIATDDPTRDAFPRDDVALALVPERKKLAVALVTEGNLFLNATLFVRENVALTTLSPAEYKGPEGFDVVVVDGVDVPMTAPGNYFVIAPAPGGPFEVEGLVKEPQLARLDKKHPLARFVKLADLNILEAEKVKTARGDAVVAAAGGGVPLLFTRDDAETGARYVVMTFDVRKSLLPMSYAFPLLMVNVLGYFHPEAAGLLVPNRAGVELSLPMALEGDDVAVAGPADAPTVHARRLGGRVHLAADRIGVYELSTAKDDKRQAVAVNLMDPEESEVSPQDQGAEPWVAPPPVLLETDPWLSNVWRLLLLIALGVVALEWLTWHRRWTL